MSLPHSFRRFRFCIAGLILAPLHADTDPIAPAEKAAGDWIKIRLETGRLENEWSTDKPLLESTANALAERATTLEEKRDHVKARTAKDREDIAAMQAKNKAAGDDLQDVESRLKELGSRLAALRPFLPPRLSGALEMSYRSLADDHLGTGERMQLAMTLINRCSQFNRTVTYGEEVLSVDGGPDEKSLEVIYWGLSHGYALDRAAGRVWYGSPGPKGWQWEPLPDSAKAVSDLIAVYADKADPEFVPVPARLGHAAQETPGKGHG